MTLEKTHGLAVMNASLAVQRFLCRQRGRSSSRQGINDATQTSAAADGETKGRRLGENKQKD